MSNPTEVMTQTTKNEIRDVAINWSKMVPMAPHKGIIMNVETMMEEVSAVWVLFDLNKKIAVQACKIKIDPTHLFRKMTLVFHKRTVPASFCICRL